MNESFFYSKTAIVAVRRDELFRSMIEFEEKPAPRILFSLKEISLRQSNKFFGTILLEKEFFRRILRDFVGQIEPRTKVDVREVFCRFCRPRKTVRSKCSSRKCFSSRVKRFLDEISVRIVPEERNQHFSILENDSNDE